MQIPSLLFAATLLAPEPAHEPRAAPPSYEAMLAEVEALTEAINAGEPVRDQLFDALAQFPRHAPLLAADPEARAIRARAQLNLARTYLSDGADESAAGIMDEILRSTTGEALPVDEFGPSIAALHAQRKAALERTGTASIAVQCHMPCRVYVNERAAERRTDGLYLGIYRIWIEPADRTSAAAPHSERVQLDEPNETFVIDFAAAAPPPIETRAPVRLMPRAAELALLVVGCGALSAGGLMIGLDPQNSPARRIAGSTLTGLGGAALLLGAITLSVDEVRLANLRGHQATLTWQIRF